ncbi:MAG: hypothetical protein GY909_08600 [Oligoflexia bacterium]|nr:hypothetical protein [Oligoflexia bacterium]
MSNSRRSFFKKALFGVASVAFLKSSETLAALAKSCPQGAPTTDKVKKKLLDYTSKTAKRLNFVANSADAKGHKKFKAGQNCANCKFYKADKKEPVYGKCAMVANKYVPSCGWCKSYKPTKK